MYSGDDAAMVADVSQHGRTRSARARQQPSEAKWMNDWGGEGDKINSGVFCLDGRRVLRVDSSEREGAK